MLAGRGTAVQDWLHAVPWALYVTSSLDSGPQRPWPSYSEWALFALVGLLALFSRVLFLDRLGLLETELSSALDAYSIWRTGRDMAGEILPVAAKSFGHFPMALSRYLSAPFVGLFGLSATPARIVSALAGCLLVFGLGMFAFRRLGPWAALGAMLSCALAPSSLQFSRLALEPILLPASLVLTLVLFDLFSKSRRAWALWASAVTLAASVYSYTYAKFFVPVWLMGFVVFFWPELKAEWSANRSRLIGVAVLFLALIAPAVVVLSGPKGFAQTHNSMLWEHFKPEEVVRVWLSNTMGYFDPGLLFVRGPPNPTQTLGGLAVWNLIDLPLMLVGLSAMLKSGANRRLFLFIGFWLLIGPLPAGLVYDSHNVALAIAWLPAAHLISGVGFASAVDWVRRERRIVPALALAGLIAAWLVTAVWTVLSVAGPAPEERAKYRLDINQTMRCAVRYRKRGERLVVSPTFIRAEPYARFYFSELEPPKDGGPRWVLEDRLAVNPDEIYLVPATPKAIAGLKLCETKDPVTGVPLAYVYGHKRIKPVPLRP